MDNDNSEKISCPALVIAKDRNEYVAWLYMKRPAGQYVYASDALVLASWCGPVMCIGREFWTSPVYERAIELRLLPSGEWVRDVDSAAAP